MNQAKKLHPAVAALIVIVLVGMVAGAVIAINNNKRGNNDTSAVTTPAASDHGHEHEDGNYNHSHGTTDTVKLNESTDTTNYENGTYSATGGYLSPGGRESIELSVTVKDGVISDTSIKNNATTPDSKVHQELFSGHYKELIVGKKLGEVESLSRVAGSSLTSNGFNNALNQIKDDARA